MKYFLFIYVLIFTTLSGDEIVIKPKELKLTSGNLFYFENTVILENNVVAKSATFSITTQYLKGVSEKKTGELKYLELHRDVIFTTATYQAFAQLAYYDPQTKILILLKKPSVKQNDCLLQAKKIIVNQSKKIITLFEPKITFFGKLQNSKLDK